MGDGQNQGKSKLAPKRCNTVLAVARMAAGARRMSQILPFWLVLVVAVALPTEASDRFDPYGSYGNLDCSFSSPSREATQALLEGNKVKAWTEAEKVIFNRVFALVEERYPVLVGLATRNHHIEWHRVDVCSLKWAAGETSHGNVFFPDTFFGSTERVQVTIIVHELAHVVDDGHRYSWSEEWCKIACPRIAAFKKRWKKSSLSCSDPEGRKGDRIAQMCGLPRAYAGEDPSECFACFVEAMHDGEAVDKEVVNYFERRIPLISGANSYDPFKDPVSDRDALEDLLCEAEHLLENDDDDTALKYFSQVLALDKNLAGPYGAMAGIWLKKANLEMAVSNYREHLGMLQKFGVSESCRSYKTAVLNLIVADFKLRRKSCPALVHGRYTSDGRFVPESSGDGRN